jgi:DNA-binding beta-propeller fold protein YncE
MKKAIPSIIVILLTYAAAAASPKVLFAIRGYSNQSLSLINLTTGEVRDSVVAIGPAANSLVLRGGRLYVVNSGGSYVGLNASITVHNIADIISDVRPLPAVVVPVPDYKNPYDMAFVSDTKAYVSYLLDSSVVVFDAQNNTLGQRIKVGKGPEGLAAAGNKVYVANAYDPSTYAFGNSVSVISATADSVLQTVTVYTNPQYVGIDQLGRPHVVSTGPYNNSGRITVLNPSTASTVGTVLMNGNISSVVFASTNAAYTSSDSLMSYNGTTLDTNRTGRNPYPIVGGSLAMDKDTLFVARTGNITLYNALTLDSLTRFLLTPGAPYFGMVVYSDHPTDVAEQLPLPMGVALEQNFPNPFNPSTAIRFYIPEAAHVSLKIFDVVGCRVATLVSAYMQPGSYATTWNAEGAASGVYFCRLEAAGSVGVKKVLLVR